LLKQEGLQLAEASFRDLYAAASGNNNLTKK
jgi:hypothetical protein